MILRILFLATLIAACSGCHDAEKERHVADLTARLELASQKSDLDQMFLCLRELQSLNAATTNQLAEYSRVEKAIPILQKIKLAQADHDHEEAVNQAADFFEFFPDHPDARQAFKESGLIFSYSESALHLIEISFIKTPDGKTSFVLDENTNLDVAKVLFNLNRADESVDKAIQLDPQFGPALRIKKSINDCRNTVGFILSLSILTEAESVSDKYKTTYNSVVETYRQWNELANVAQQVAQATGSQNSENYAAKCEAIVEKYKQNVATSAKPSMDACDKLCQMLSEIKTSDASGLFSTLREMTLKLHALADAVENFDGTEENSRNVSTSVSAIKESLAQLGQSLPNENATEANIAGFSSLTEKIALFKSPDKTRQSLEKFKSLIAD